MVSRRKILSRSIDDLDIEEPQEDDEDVWHQKEKLFLEHLQEVIDKWEQIDDEIWAKVIVFEKNRRVAKAYARAPVLTINNSQDGFDGMRIGLCGFDNPLRDQKTEDAKRYVGQGVKIKMDDEGNILIRRYAKSNVYVKNLNGENLNVENSLSNDILKLPNQALGNDAIFKLFDMKKFQSNINRELRQAYPDRKRLELQCLSAVVFVKSDAELLNCPIWVLVVNVVAMDMLRTKLPPMHRLLNPKIRPRLPIPEEDSIYGVSGNTNNNSNNNNTINNNDNLHNGKSNGIHENSDSSGYGSNGIILTNGSSYESNGFTNHNGNHTNGNGIHHHHHQHHHQNGGGGFNDITNDMNNNNINGNIKNNNIEPFYQTHTKKIQNAPKLPPRDKDGNPQQPQQQQQQQMKEDLPTPDYESDDIKIKQFIFRNKHNSTNNNNNVNYDGTNNKKEKEKKKIVSEDPYYCGLSARVPKYDQKKSALKKLQKNLNNLIVPKRMSIAYFQHPNATGAPYINGYQYQSQQQLFLQAPPLSPQFIAPPPPPTQSNYHHNTLWHARSMESGLDFPSEFNVQYFPFDRPDYRMVARRPV